MAVKGSCGRAGGPRVGKKGDAKPRGGGGRGRGGSGRGMGRGTGRGRK